MILCLMLGTEGGHVTLCLQSQFLPPTEIVPYPVNPPALPCNGVGGRALVSGLVGREGLLLRLIVVWGIYLARPVGASVMGRARFLS